jgi:hypothetical protein
VSCRHGGLGVAFGALQRLDVPRAAPTPRRLGPPS